MKLRGAGLDACAGSGENDLPRFRALEYFKTKGFKTRLEEDSPFEEPSHQELEKWGRFQVVEDAKRADLLLRVYETGTPHPVPVERHQHGQRGHHFRFRASCPQNDLSYTSKNTGLNWSTKTAGAALFKNLRNMWKANRARLKPRGRQLLRAHSSRSLRNPHGMMR